MGIKEVVSFSVSPAERKNDWLIQIVLKDVVQGNERILSFTRQHAFAKLHFLYEKQDLSEAGINSSIDRRQMVRNSAGMGTLGCSLDASDIDYLATVQDLRFTQPEWFDAKNKHCAQFIEYVNIVCLLCEGLAAVTIPEGNAHQLMPMQAVFTKMEQKITLFEIPSNTPDNQVAPQDEYQFEEDQHEEEGIWDDMKGGRAIALALAVSAVVYKGPSLLTAMSLATSYTVHAVARTPYLPFAAAKWMVNTTLASIGKVAPKLS